MGFWGDLWNGIKSVGGKIYDGVRSVGNFASNIWDKVKPYVPAPIRTVGDTVQNTYNQVRSVGDVIRSNPLGLKDGGRVDVMPPPFIGTAKPMGKIGTIFPMPVRTDQLTKKYYQTD